MQKYKLIPSAIILSLCLYAQGFAAVSENSSDLFKEQVTNPAPDSTIKVQNGVTVKAGTPIAQTPQIDTKIDVDTVTKPDSPAGDTSKTVEKPIEKPAEKPIEKPKAEAPKTVRMKPIISNGPALRSPSKTNAIKTPAIEKTESPFKKSVDSNARETVKTPEPKPEVTSTPLVPAVAADIAKEVQKLDSGKPGERKLVNAEGKTVGESGLPIPRFVSLKSGEINARSGPGENYPIRWLYQRKNLPMEITAEFKMWRRIKDFDGEETWVHQAMLSSRRYAIILHDATAHTDPEDEGPAVARFKRGVQVKVPECKKDYCQVEYGHTEGWLKKKDLWGIYADEVFN